MTSNELREKFIEFFIKNNHKEISSKSLIPDNDPTVLFNTAGMQPLVPYILGQEHPQGKRLVNVQRCIRTGDIEEVGDNTHLTSFEMLGNWSLGDYFKEEAISLSFQFLTQELNIDPKRLSVSVFEGEEGIDFDHESKNLWIKQGLTEDQIYSYGRSENWWGPAGQVGPCGPDTEMFIDTLKESECDNCVSGLCNCGKYVEIWNDVFMQYEKQSDGSFTEMNRKCVDTGMGLERALAIFNGKTSVYDTDLFIPIIQKLEEISGKKYNESLEIQKAMRIISDHIKAALFILGESAKIVPSNTGQGYILRRLIRRSMRFGRKLGLEKSFLSDLVDSILQIYEQSYTHLLDQRDYLKEKLREEEDKFLKTLVKGEIEFEKKLESFLKNPKKIIAGRIAFNLYDTYGFPLEITEELAKEHGLSVDREGFLEAQKKHQEKSKEGGQKIFKGGLADNNEATTALHTATHLLHKALRVVLGDHVEQRGSNITAQRLRFDFSHSAKMSDEEKEKVENLVNEQIQKNLVITMTMMSLEEAKNKGAMALFEGKYDERVKVYSIGDFSLEVCGGPHLENTKDMGVFKIQKEQASSAGVRRIKAVLS